ncbi:hypothetical protein [Mycolicibacterium sp.]|uniref:hypothetical protein n=1 Tax=Mycolicibacterium sp. TaxID=2320850 RepID=UPI0037C4F652
MANPQASVMSKQAALRKNGAVNQGYETTHEGIDPKFDYTESDPYGTFLCRRQCGSNNA